MEKQRKEKKQRDNGNGHDVRGNLARHGSCESGYRAPVHMDASSAPKKRNVGFMVFIVASAVVWPCLLMYFVMREPVFILLACIAISAMVLSLMFEDAQYGD